MNLARHYTPPRLAARLVHLAMAGWDGPCAHVLDPAAGAGALLDAARDLRPGVALYGVDLDPDAAIHQRDDLWHRRGNALLGATREVVPPLLSPDAWAASVAGPRTDWLHWAWELPGSVAAGFDLVLANPPFLNQLERASVLDRGAVALLRAILPHVGGAYADVATLFVARSWALLRPGGRLAFVLPQSFLAARDAASVRALLAREGALVAVELVPGRPFDADVAVCLLVAEKSTGAGPVDGLAGAGLAGAVLPGAVLPGGGASWSSVVADQRGVPALPEAAGATLGELATTTADFRDEFYGLVGHVDAGPGPGRVPLALTGHIEPGRLDHARTVRFAGTPYVAPHVAVDALPGKLGPWARSRLRPKLLVATQTRILEAAPDPTGAWLTTTPVVSVFPREAGQLWHLLAALSSPYATAWALTHHGGTALSSEHVKLSAAALRSLPLPAGGAAWDAAAVQARAFAEGRGSLEAVGAAANDAYGGSPALYAWWLARATPARRSRRSPPQPS